MVTNVDHLQSIQTNIRSSFIRTSNIKAQIHHTHVDRHINFFKSARYIYIYLHTRAHIYIYDVSWMYIIPVHTCTLEYRSTGTSIALLQRPGVHSSSIVVEMRRLTYIP